MVILFMKKALFIIPYFGEFKSYFQLFLDSCAYNSDFNWLIITDNHKKYNYPENVRVVYSEFKDLQDRIRSKFDFDVTIDRPYKLCDYKPAYGYIFSNYIKGFKMWGYCDTDLIFGNIGEFISIADINRFAKIGIFGHCTLIKNEEKYNKAFMLPLNGENIFEEVYKSKENHSFDEEFNKSINNIFEQYGYEIKEDLKLANIYTKSSNFKLTTLNADKHSYSVEPLKKKALFIFNNGILSRVSKNNNSIIRKVYAYIHMQSRSMRVSDDLNYKLYKIIPNSFDNLEVSKVTKANFESIKIKHFNMHYFKLRSHNLLLKIKKGVIKIWKQR